MDHLAVCVQFYTSLFTYTVHTFRQCLHINVKILRGCLDAIHVLSDFGDKTSVFKDKTGIVFLKKSCEETKTNNMVLETIQSNFPTLSVHPNSLALNEELGLDCL